MLRSVIDSLRRLFFHEPDEMPELDGTMDEVDLGLPAQLYLLRVKEESEQLNAVQLRKVLLGIATAHAFDRAIYNEFLEMHGLKLTICHETPTTPLDMLKHLELHE